MKELKSFLIFCCFVLIASPSADAASPYCTNLGFELGNFSNWVGYTWIYSTIPDITSTPKVMGIVNGRQTIMTDTTATDPNTGGKLKKIPNGYRYSARLGNAVTGALDESLSYKMTVDSTNALLVWKFAVVLQDPLNNHLRYEEPRFKVTLLDQLGDTINSCANYDVHVSDAKISGFQTYNPAGATYPIIWRDWTTVGANLTPYIGQTISIEFMAADCTHKAHYGYAYFVAECHPMYITVKYCTGDSDAALTAPDGFETYSWVDDSGVVVGTSKSLVLVNPTEGATFTCNMNSATGCQVALKSTIARYQPNADFRFDLVDCNNLGNTQQFTNLHPATHGTLEYSWNFGDGTTSTAKNPAHTFTTSGMHQVGLLVKNPPSLCTDSVSKMVETFYPPLVGITGEPTYCPGYTTTLRGHGAYRYEWSNGSKADFIQVGKDTTVWLIGYSSAGCYTDTIKFNVRQEPDWTFTVDGNPLFCYGESTTLTAMGANSYRWNTGETTNSITVTKPGLYTVTGSNLRGCEKTLNFTVVEDSLPNVNFTMSSATVDARHNQLTCSVPNVAGMQYVWDMGDGGNEMGPMISHTYSVSNSLQDYSISLTATNINGCANSMSKTVDIIPFIPNVFSPNGDSVNDLFMPGVQLQVFDRSGALIYKGNSGWNGMSNNKKLDDDTYFYFLSYTDKYQQVQTRKGYVTLKK